MMRGVWVMLVAGAACVTWPEPEVEPEVDADDGKTRTVAELRDNPPVLGAVVTVSPLVVISDAATVGGTVYVQDPDDGSGVAVRPGGQLDGWPPESGTLVRVRGVSAGTSSVPLLYLRDTDDVTIEGTAEVVVAEQPMTPPLPFTLARWSGVVITSPPDPSGRANTAYGFPIEDRFGLELPGWQSMGTLTGIVLPSGAVTPRVDDDWSGTRADASPVETTLEEVLAGTYPDGTWVVFSAVQATPWSRGGREVVLQADDGRGIWLDTEGFGEETGVEGERGRWRGVVVRDGNHIRLRSWWDREPLGEGSIAISEGTEDGRVVVLELTGLGPPDVTGERVSDQGWIADDRFRDISGLAGTVRVRGVVRTGAGGAALLAVIGLDDNAP